MLRSSLRHGNCCALRNWLVTCSTVIITELYIATWPQISMVCLIDNHTLWGEERGPGTHCLRMLRYPYTSRSASDFLSHPVIDCSRLTTLYTPAAMGNFCCRYSQRNGEQPRHTETTSYRPPTSGQIQRHTTQIDTPSSNLSEALRQGRRGTTGTLIELTDTQSCTSQTEAACLNYLTQESVSSFYSLNADEHYSTETRTMVQCSKKLILAISADPRTIAGTLYQMGVISDEINDKMLLPTSTSQEKAAILVSAVRDAVKVNPSRFLDFVDILTRESWTKDIVAELKSTHQTNLGICIHIVA